MLSDYDHFAFQVDIPKEALKKMKELMLQTQLTTDGKSTDYGTDTVPPPLPGSTAG